MNKVILIIRTIVFLPFLGVCILVVTGSVKSSNQQESAIDYIPTKATVIESRVKIINTVGTKGSSGKIYKPYIRYEYDVNGKTYYSDKLGYNARPKKDNDGTANSYIKNYRPGSVVTAYYNAKNPEEVVLTRKENNHSTIMIVFATALAALFFAIIVLPGILSLKN
jgi:hypothetical protein